MFKSYSHSSLGLQKPTAHPLSSSNRPHHNASTSNLNSIGPDKYQSWRFFNPNSLTLQSQTSVLQQYTATIHKNHPLSPVKSLKAQQGKSNLQEGFSSRLTHEGGQGFGKKKRKLMKGSLVDQIIEAAQQTQEQENREFFLTHVQSESILPPITLGDKHEYKSLMHKQKQISYLVAKHVRLASERLKFGKVVNSHYQHYEKVEPLDIVIAKVKPSEATLNYKPRVQPLQKPSLELMKTVNRKLLEEKIQNNNDAVTRDLIQDTYNTFGMNRDDIEDVNEILAEEGDKVDYDAKEIKFTEHQLEFKNICTKVNKEKSAEIFIKTNKDFSKWNLKDKNKQTFFLSRVASKEPRDFIEKEIEEKKLRDEEFLYLRPPIRTKITNKEKIEAEVEKEEDDDSQEYEYYSETEKASGIEQEIVQNVRIETAQEVDRATLLSANDQRLKASSLSQPPKSQRRRRSSKSSSKVSKGTYLSKIEKQFMKEEEDKKIQEEQIKEEEEMKKFIFLEKLKYEKSIKGYDRLAGMKTNLDDFTDVLMHKLFKKREPTNEFKYILKKDNTHHRVDHSKPLYMDDLKRFQKLLQVGGKKKLNLVQHERQDIKRDFQDINIFNADIEEDLRASKESLSKVGKTGSINKKIQPDLQQESRGLKKYSSAWYLPVTQWGQEIEVKSEQKQQQASDMSNIGVLTKQALKYLLTPYKEGSQKKIKMNNRDDQIIEEEE